MLACLPGGPAWPRLGGWCCHSPKPELCLCSAALPRLVQVVLTVALVGGGAAAPRGEEVGGGNRAQRSRRIIAFFAAGDRSPCMLAAQEGKSHTWSLLWNR